MLQKVSGIFLSETHEWHARMADTARSARLHRCRRRVVVLYLVLAVVAAGTFAWTLGYPFVYDDRSIITQNPLLESAGGWCKILVSPYWPPEQGFDSLYRPLTALTFKMNYALGGGQPCGFRVVNLALHALATVLVAALARRLWRRDAAAWVAGLLFAVHPIHAEALGLVVGRGELLAGVLVTWMLWRHLGRDVTEAAPSPGYHLATAVLFLLALGAKEHAVIAWPAILITDLWHRRCSAKREPRRSFLHRIVESHHLGLAFALALFLFMRWVVYGGWTTMPADMIDPFANPLLHGSFITKSATPFALLWFVVQQWFAATPLCPIWDVGGFDLPGTFLRADVLAGVVVAGGIVSALVVGWRRRGRWCVPVGLFALAVLLPCHFIPAANWLYAERWVYLPSVFLALLCAGLTAWVPRFSVGAAAAAAALLLVITVPYSRCWQTHEGLFEAVVERQTCSYHGLIGLAAIRYRTGRVGESRVGVERLTERFPDAQRAWYYRVLVAGELGDWDAADDALRRWAAFRLPGPPPPEITRIAEQVRAHGR